MCSAADWSAVAQQVRARRRTGTVCALLTSYDLGVESVTRDDAEWAARRWRAREGLSLADRLRLALGERLDAIVWTTDRSWGSRGRVRQVR